MKRIYLIATIIVLFGTSCRTVHSLRTKHTSSYDSSSTQKTTATIDQNTNSTKDSAGSKQALNITETNITETRNDSVDVKGSDVKGQVSTYDTCTQTIETDDQVITFKNNPATGKAEISGKVKDRKISASVNRHINKKSTTSSNEITNQHATTNINTSANIKSADNTEVQKKEKDIEHKKDVTGIPWYYKLLIGLGIAAAVFLFFYIRWLMLKGNVLFFPFLNSKKKKDVS